MFRNGKIIPFQRKKHHIPKNHLQNQAETRHTPDNKPAWQFFYSTDELNVRVLTEFFKQLIQHYALHAIIMHVS
jgi:hypothetical protein